MAATSPAGRVSHLLYGSAAGVAAAAAFASLGLEGEVAWSVIPPLFVGLAPFVDERIRERRTSAAQAAGHMERGLVPADPRWLAVKGVLLLVAAERLFLITSGVVFAVLLTLLGGVSDVSFWDLLSAGIISPTTSSSAMIGMAVVMVFFAKYLSHRVGSPLLWLVGCSAGVVVLDLLIAVVVLEVGGATYEIGDVATTLAALGALLLVGSLIGRRWARRDRSAYLLKRMFLRIDDEAARRAVIDLVLEEALPRPEEGTA